MARILIVEDDVAIAKLLRIHLEHDGHILTFVTDGQQALAAVRAQPPDLILLDVMLPGMDGFQVAKRLRLDIATQHLPIVMLTARADGASMMAGLAQGADAYVTKPIDFPELIRRIETCLRQSVMPALRPADN
jgi:DNA-binding response OmpR family regulator